MVTVTCPDRPKGSGKCEDSGRDLAPGSLTGSSYPSPRCGLWGSGMGTVPYQVAFLSVHLLESMQPGSSPSARPELRPELRWEPELRITMCD